MRRVSCLSRKGEEGRRGEGSIVQNGTRGRDGGKEGRLMGLSSQSAMALLPPSSPLRPFHRTSPTVTLSEEKEKRRKGSDRQAFERERAPVDAHALWPFSECVCADGRPSVRGQGRGRDGRRQWAGVHFGLSDP